VTLATSPTQHGIVIESNQNVRLASLAFAVEATGALALNLSTGRAGGNCGAVAMSGGGITATQITLFRNSDMTCNPLVLAISAGATKPMSSYTINCAMPLNGPCIENDQSITATGVAADSYTIHITAKQGPLVCWTNNDSIVVPPLGATLTRQLNLGFTATTGCM